MPQTGMPPDRDMENMPAPGVDRNQPFFPGPVGDSGVSQDMTSMKPMLAVSHGYRRRRTSGIGSSRGVTMWPLLRAPLTRGSHG